MIKQLPITVLLLFFAMLHTTGVRAADIRPFISNSGSYRAIVVEGDIEPGDFKKFVRIAKENQGKVSGVYIFSPGGDFYEAMKIGRAMRALELSSQVPMRGTTGRPVCEGDDSEPKPKNPENCTCASAGFFVHIGAIHRGGTYLAVHRPYFVKGRFGNLSQSDAQKAFDALQDSAHAYMQEMGVPKHIQEEVLGTPSERVLVLDDKTVKTYFWLELPYRHEWKKNRCSKLSELENQRIEDYSLLLSQTRNLTETNLSKAEWNNLSDLHRKRNEEIRCDIEIEKQSRVEAYTRYFGVQPIDSVTQDFSEWSGATKYLGRLFHDLQAEDRFEEEELAGSYFLNRAATTTTPAISLSNFRTRQKIVSWIGMVSTPSPSPEYTQRLIQSLEIAWGKPSGGSGASKWLWEKREFLAKLTYEPVSAEGPFLSLVITSK